MEQLMVATPPPLNQRPDDSPFWQVPALEHNDRILGGVAAGVAHELGVDPIWVRLASVVLFAAGGWGALIYLVGWGTMAQLAYVGRGPTHPPTPKGTSSRARIAGLSLTTLGAVIFFSTLPGLRADVAWPLGILGAGMLIAWRQLADGDRGHERFGATQLIGGVVAALGGVALLLDFAFDVTAGGTVVWAAVGVAVGLVAVSAPWWSRMVRDLDAERQARARSDERAEVAAHLHDSVLQTLTLIQRHGDDPQTMRNLARRQERELRNWLDPSRVDRSGHSVRGRLDELATELEELHGVPLEVVAVGDCLVNEPVAAALAAAREAAVNAAKHSGADQIDLYVEVGDELLEIFVRDTGVGFDPNAVAGDRRGISESIRGRMERAGGTVEIISAPGAGTEVELAIARPHRSKPDSAQSDSPQSDSPQSDNPQSDSPQSDNPQTESPEP